MRAVKVYSEDERDGEEILISEKPAMAPSNPTHDPQPPLSSSTTHPPIQPPTHTHGACAPAMAPNTPTTATSMRPSTAVPKLSTAAVACRACKGTSAFKEVKTESRCKRQCRVDTHGHTHTGHSYPT